MFITLMTFLTTSDRLVQEGDSTPALTTIVSSGENVDTSEIFFPVQEAGCGSYEGMDHSAPGAIAQIRSGM